MAARRRFDPEQHRVNAWGAKHARVDRDHRACGLCGVCDCTWAYFPPGPQGLRAAPHYRCEDCRPASGNPLVDEIASAA